MSIMSLPRKIKYPDTDGKPMAENTLQFRWIVTIKEGVDRVFHNQSDVFVAGDLFWYPVEGHPEICQTPDVLIAFGRPKGDRGSYKQWEEEGIAPQVVFEVLSPGNRTKEMIAKFKFYEHHGVDEYYIYDPDEVELTGYKRDGDELKEISELDGWISARLGIRFGLSGRELVIYGPDGQRFLTFQELADERDQAVQQRDQAVQQRNEAVQQRDEAVQRLDQLAQDRDHAVQLRDAERQRAERMAAQLRALGIEPPA